MRNYETNGKEHWFFTREEFDHLLETEENEFFTEIVNEEEKAKDPHYHGVRYVTRKKDLPLIVQSGFLIYTESVN